MVGLAEGELLGSGVGAMAEYVGTSVGPTVGALDGLVEGCGVGELGFENVRVTTMPVVAIVVLSVTELVT